MSDENNKLLKEILEIIITGFYVWGWLSVVGFVVLVAMIIYHW